jgi:hypothetical protein
MGPHGVSGHPAHHPVFSHVYVIADGESYTTSPDAAIDRQRATIRASVEALKETCRTVAIPCSRETVFPPLYMSIRAALAKIRRENRRARFTFDLSYGQRDLCMALLSLAPWLGGDVFCSFGARLPQRVPAPDRAVPAMLANVNYQTILAVLLRNRPVPVPATGLPFIPRQYLFSQVWPLYVRQRARKPDPEKPVPQYTRGRKPANDLSQATFSWFMKTLAEAGLVEEGPDSKNRKEKSYRITQNGETAFRFFADPATNSIVKQMLDGL